MRVAGDRVRSHEGAYETLLQVYWHNIDPRRRAASSATRQPVPREISIDEAQVWPQRRREGSGKEVRLRGGEDHPASTFYPRGISSGLYTKDPGSIMHTARDARRADAYDLWGETRGLTGRKVGDSYSPDDSFNRCKDSGFGRGSVLWRNHRIERPASGMARCCRAS
jgi:hypothetical protein